MEIPEDVAKTVKYVFDLPHEITIPSIEVRHIKNLILKMTLMNENKTNINCNTEISEKNYTQTIENTEFLILRFLHIFIKAELFDVQRPAYINKK